MKIKIIKRCLFRWCTLAFLLMLQPFVVLSQHSSEQQSISVTEFSQNQSIIKTEVLFPFGTKYLDLNFKNNQVNLLGFLVRLDEIIADSNYVVTGIEVAGGCLPEGNSEYNLQIAGERAVSLFDYIVTHGKIPAKKIKIVNLGENWVELKTLVQSSDMPRKQVVLSLMDRYGDDYTSLKNAIIQDQDGKTWDWMRRHFFSKLRRGTGDICHITLFYSPSATNAHHEQSQEFIGKNRSSVKSANGINTNTQTLTNVVIENNIARKPLFALKTNLLFDAASLLNLELEVPIGKRFSVAGEVVAPWWLWKNKQHCLQVMSGNVEGRYWFGNRDITSKGTPRHIMTGWFAGLYVGGGYYDLERNKKGYQGEFFIAAGASGGYAHTINKSGNLRMEYSLGVGFMQTDYREYQARMDNDNQWHLYRQNDGKFSWFGPTRVKVSLVWMLNRNVK